MGFPPVTCPHLTMPATPSMSLMTWTLTSEPSFVQGRGTPCSRLVPKLRGDAATPRAGPGRGLPGGALRAPDEEAGGREPSGHLRILRPLRRDGLVPGLAIPHHGRLADLRRKLS